VPVTAANTATTVYTENGSGQDADTCRSASCTGTRRRAVTRECDLLDRRDRNAAGDGDARTALRTPTRMQHRPPDRPGRGQGRSPSAGELTRKPRKAITALARRVVAAADDLRAPLLASTRRSLQRQAGVSSMSAFITRNAGEIAPTRRAGFRRRPPNCGVSYLRQIVRFGDAARGLSAGAETARCGRRHATSECRNQAKAQATDGADTS
jgi:hypothetical protein